MKRSYAFVKPVGTARCRLPSGAAVTVPVVAGILKHPTVDSLRTLLRDPAVAHKYTVAAIRTAPWRVLRRFPRPWLEACMPESGIGARRRQAIEFLLNGPRRIRRRPAARPHRPR